MRDVERAARESYGRLLALLLARGPRGRISVAAAEDALADSFRVALESWPRDGVPRSPEAWLLTAARRRLGGARRHLQVRENAAATLALLGEEMASTAPGGFPDERLKLLFVCAHPAIAEDVRTPLMLQTVLGLDAARIAAAFLVPPATMGQRLVRAKAKIRDAGIRFEAPEPADMPGRLAAVLQAIYAAYGLGWDAGPGGEGADTLAGEALYLARLAAGLMPEEPEARGLLALILYCESRAAARQTADGRFVALAEQDVALWRRELIIEAENQLTAAARMGKFGRFQTEAAIQSVHAQRAVTGRPGTAALVALYDLLAEHEPSVGALVARAAVHGEAYGPQQGLLLLGGLAERADAYQPYWVARAHLLESAGLAQGALAALERAVDLTRSPPLREHLRQRMAKLAP